MNNRVKTWGEMFPNGRHVYYEGDNPKAFVDEMKAKFNFDPSLNNPGWRKGLYSFDLPGHLMDAVYGSDEYELGS